MPDDWILEFHGGGCDMQKTAGSMDAPPHANVACGGTVYTVYRVESDQYLALLPSADPPNLYEPGPTAAAPISDADVLNAWHGLTRGIGRQVPRAVNRTRTLRGRIRAVGRR